MKNLVQKQKRLLRGFILIAIIFGLIADFAYAKIMESRANIVWNGHNIEKDTSSILYNNLRYETSGGWLFWRCEDLHLISRKKFGVSLIAMEYECPLWHAYYYSYSRENPDYIICKELGVAVYFREGYDPYQASLTVLNATDTSKLENFCLADLVAQEPLDAEARQKARDLFFVECCLTEHPFIRIKLLVKTYGGKYYARVKSESSNPPFELSPEYAEMLLAAYGV